MSQSVSVRSSRLTIPHERMSERRFVLVPLRELAARVRHDLAADLATFTVDLPGT